MARFTVPMAPVPQPRQRVTMRGRFPIVYTSSKHPVNEFKATIRQVAAQCFDEMLEGPLVAEVVFIFPRPQAKMWKKRPMLRERHVGARDLDNLLKAVLDALTGIAFKNDGQICDLRATKWIAAGDESPHVDIEVEQIYAINAPGAE